MALFLPMLFVCLGQAQDIEYPLPDDSKSAKDIPDVNAAESDDGEDLIDEQDPIREAEKQQTAKKRVKETVSFKEEEEEDSKDISTLSNLAPFSDVAIIQKRFLPKTSRFEFYPSLGAMVNNPFFLNTMINLRLGYYFSEKLGFELQLAKIFSARQRVTKDLEEQKNVFTSSFIIPEMYYGADIKWSPVYGKMGFFNKSIIPFDMYFTGGAGLTPTNQDTSPVTFHVGTGQVFALSKSFAARWDVSAYFYSSSTDVAARGVTEGSFTDLYVSLGVCFYFPEATYR